MGRKKKSSSNKNARQQQQSSSSNRSVPLRFMLGDDVYFKRSDGVIGWNAGTVEEIWYRNAKWPDKRPSCPYRVKQKSSLPSSANGNDMVLILEDTDWHIRPLVHPRYPSVPLLYGDVPLPEPKDPFNYLYIPFPKNDQLKISMITAGFSISRWSNDDGNNEVKDTNKAANFVYATCDDAIDDGMIVKVSAQSNGVSSHLWDHDGPSESVGGSSSNNILFLPRINDDNQEGISEYRGVDSVMISNYVCPRIHLRRPLHHQYVAELNAEQIIDSIFPEEESSAKELQETISILEQQHAKQQGSNSTSSYSTTPTTTATAESNSLLSYDSILKRCKKLLNLGDAYLYLFKDLGCERDIQKAQMCYIAAGFDLPLNEVMTTPGTHALGIPEAICATATIFHTSTERMAYAKLKNLCSLYEVNETAGIDRPMLDTDEILSIAMNCGIPHHDLNRTIIENLAVIWSYLSTALRNGWFCVLAFHYGKTLNNIVDNNKQEILMNIWDHPVDQKNIERLRQAHRNHQIKNQIREEKLSKTKITRHGVPLPETLAIFAPKAIDILRNIPTYFSDGSQKQLSNSFLMQLSPLSLFTTAKSQSQPQPQPSTLNLHISFFELPVPSAPVCVLIFCRTSNFVEILRLPDELQLFPFSKTAFDWIWNRIAFMIHIGINKQENPHHSRVRPASFIMKSIGGDNMFATFLQWKCFELPGTKVKLIQVQNEYEDGYGLHDLDHDLLGSFFIEAGIEELVREEHIKANPVLVNLNHNSKESILKSVRKKQTNTVNNKPDNKIMESTILEKVEKAKIVGNKSYARKKYIQALKHYQRALQDIRRVLNPSKRETYALVATLLSNYALCGLEYAKTQSATVGTHILKETMAACSLAIDNADINNALPLSLQTKLQQRRSLAASRQPSNDPALFYRKDERRGDSLAYTADINFNLRLFQEDNVIKDDKQKQVLEMVFGETLNSKEHEEVCPMCYEEYSTALANNVIVKLQCGHLHCAKCFLSWRKWGEEDSYAMKCTVCRQVVGSKEWDSTLGSFVSKNCASIEENMNNLPFQCEADRLEVLRSMLLQHKLDLNAVSNAVDDMLYLNNFGKMWQMKDLSPCEKEEIYAEARRPIIALQKEIEEIENERIQIIDTTSNEFQIVNEKLRKLQEDLHNAKQNASQEILSRMNSEGAMGRENDKGEILLDFHGLHVKEAKEMIDSTVLSVLPVLGKVILVTGRGVHSSNNKIGILKHAVQHHLKQKHSSVVQCNVVKNNPGALELEYISACQQSLD